MFPGHYWPPSYWAGNYYPGSGSGVTPGVDSILFDQILQLNETSGDGLIFEARARHLVFYIIGSSDITGGSVLIEEASDAAGPWTYLFDEYPVDVVSDSVIALHVGPGSYGFVQARIVSPITGGGTVTVRVLGTIERKDLTLVEGFQPPFQLWISGVQYPPRIGSINYVDDLNNINTLGFALWDENGEWSFENGETVTLRNTADEILFAGTIEVPTVSREDDIRSGLRHRFTAVDYNQLPIRKLVADAYDNTTFEDIVEDIVLTHLAPEGVSIGVIDPGPTFIRKVFNYRSVQDCFRELSEDTGFIWWIDYNRVFYFRNRLAVAAPFLITPETIRSVELSKSRSNYRNRQYISGGRGLADPVPESFVGDSERQTFNVALPIGKVPIITLNAIPQTVGIKGVDDDEEFDWYWNKNYTEVSQKRSATPLLDTDLLVVTYQGLYPIRVQAQDDAEIARRVAIEGGSGLYEFIDEHPEIEDVDLAFDLAVAKLQREGRINKTIRIVTDRPGLATGQFAHVALPYLNLDETFLVFSVLATDTTETFLRYTVTLLSGEGVNGWLTFFQKLMASRRAAQVREDELLNLLRTISEGVLCGEVLESEELAPERRIGFGKFGLSEIA